MNKFLVLFVVITACVSAGSNVYSADNAKVAMGDIGSFKSSLSGEADTTAAAQTWSQLSDDQHKVLAPLGAEWDTLRPWQREKMLDIANDYPKMDAQKQQRMQKRLNSWSRMTPYERENARRRYQEFNALSAEKKDEIRRKWTDYQKLPEADRTKLHKDAGSLGYDPDLE